MTRPNPRPRVAAVIIAAIIFCMAAASGLARAEMPAGCPVPTPQKLDTAAPINLGLVKSALVYYRCTAYDGEVAKTLEEARAWVAQRVSQVAKPAVVLDIDETSLSNWAQLYHNDFGYSAGGLCDLKSTSACGQREWELSAKAIAIEPTLELFKLAKEQRGKEGQSVAVFFVSGRPEDPFERTATEWNLRKAGYDGWAKLVLRPEGQPTAEFKTKARQDIEAEGYTIIANVGDQLSDLAGEHAERCFKVPNPFFFIPGGTVPEGGLACLKR